MVVGASLQKESKLVKDSVGNQKDPVKDSVGGVDSIIESIIVHQNIISQEGPVQVGAIGGETSLNTFECLALIEDSASLEGGEELASTSYGIVETAEYSDTSPICDTFKLVKRIDELDFSPSQPMSKSKLKRLKKQHRASKLTDGKKVTISIDFFFWISKNLLPKEQSNQTNKIKTSSQRRPGKTKNGQHLP